MQAGLQVRCRAVAPLLFGLVLALAGCGGGGGGGADGSSAQSGALAAGTASNVSTSNGTASATGSPSGPASNDSSDPPSTTTAEVRYTLGPVDSVEHTPNDSAADYQNLVGMSTTGDGGYRIVWMTAAFDAAGTLQRTYFEQRFDAAGQRIGGKTGIAEPTEDLSASRSARVEALGGGYVQVAPPDALRPSLRVQHFDADGTPVDEPVQLGGASHGWSMAWLPLPDGSIAMTWQPLSSVRPGPLQAALLVPGAR